MTGGAGAPEEEPVHCVCGRLLSDPVSRARGLGPHCYRQLQARTAPRPRRLRTPAAGPHPRAVPEREPTQLALDWDDDDPEPEPAQAITDVPTGALL
ncbi:DUF6011 domain-containing protein [Streptomyces sp. bgisy034]|uniref:DUF6011 domain-containing protein n=1 Tax=Streptomyces sp. bgisy034 TaxID=3413774 RepID=UPI003EB94F6C